MILRIFNKILVVILIFMIVYTVTYVEPVKVQAEALTITTGMLLAAGTALVAGGLVASSADDFTEACELFVYDMFNKDGKLFTYFKKCAVAGVFFFNFAMKLFTINFVNELKDGTAMTGTSFEKYFFTNSSYKGTLPIGGILYRYSSTPTTPYFYYEVNESTSASSGVIYFEIRRRDINGNFLSHGSVNIRPSGITWKPNVNLTDSYTVVEGPVTLNSFFYNRVTRSWFLKYNDNDIYDFGQHQFVGKCTRTYGSPTEYAQQLRGDMTWLTPLATDTYSLPNDPGLSLEAYNDVAVKTNEYVNADGDTVPVTGVNDLVNVDTSVDTLVQTTDYPLDDTQTDTGVDTGTITGALTDFFKVESLDLTGFQNLAITNKFPFCIPFDLVESIQMFSAQAKDPKFEIKLDGQFLKVDHEIDLSRFNFILGFFRYFVVMCFVWFLINKTRDFIKW